MSLQVLRCAAARFPHPQCNAQDNPSWLSDLQDSFDKAKNARTAFMIRWMSEELPAAKAKLSTEQILIEYDEMTTKTRWGE